MIAAKVAVAALLGLVLLALALVAGALAMSGVPLSGPPGAAARLKQFLTTNHAVAGAAASASLPELEAPVFAQDPAALMVEVEAAARALGWTEVRRDGNAGRLRAVVVTPLLGFRDDVTVEVRPAGGAGATLEARSRSRVGRGDLGANAGHLLRLLNELRRRTGTGGVTPAS